MDAYLTLLYLYIILDFGHDVSSIVKSNNNIYLAKVRITLRSNSVLPLKYFN